MKDEINRSPFTLAQTWKYCLAMWEWVSDIYIQDRGDSVEDLKEQWCRENRVWFEKTSTYCFFCDYANHRKDSSCQVSCPGVRVSPRFDCFNPTYSYRDKPVKFYKKLLKMEKKRKRKGEK